MEEATSEKYQVFGRKEYMEPLAFVGEVIVEESADPLREALRFAEGESWVELVAFPSSAVIEVMPLRNAQ